ncbi:MAG: LacI family DNA-binding transcriptional regulator [Sphaerochaeta sp.]|nr:LacI family DNA-binding transcriptional regulator [Sphaerochaeta sp.]
MAGTSLKKIAAEAGVSVTVVSLVLNNKATEARIAKDTQQRILAIAKRENYVPNRLASALKSKHTKILAIVVPFTPVGFFVELIYHIEQYAITKGYQAMVINTFNDEKKEQESLSLYRSGLFDGMFIASLNKTSSRMGVYQAMEKASFPFVFVDRYAEGIKADIISSDHFKASYDMTTKMIGTGKQNILLLNRSGQAVNSTAKLREDGYIAAMKDHTLEPWIQSFILTSGESEHDTNLAEVLKSLPQKPEAIFLHSGFYMPHLIKAYGESSFRESKSEFMTVDNFSFTQDLIVQKNLLEHVVGHFLITVQDIRQIAKIACDTLLAHIEDKDGSAEHKTIHVPTYSFWG